MTFAVHPKIAATTTVVGDLPLCRVLLANERRYPWLMLLPRTEIDEICDLPEADQMQLMRESAAASLAVRTLFNPDKLNIGALGNSVRQLHYHVVGRWTSDPSWPGPIWGKPLDQPYAPDELAHQVARYQQALAPAGLKAVAS